MYILGFRDPKRKTWRDMMQEASGSGRERAGSGCGELQHFSRGSAGTTAAWPCKGIGSDIVRNAELQEDGTYKADSRNIRGTAEENVPHSTTFAFDLNDIPMEEEEEGSRPESGMDLGLGLRLNSNAGEALQSNRTQPDETMAPAHFGLQPHDLHLNHPNLSWIHPLTNSYTQPQPLPSHHLTNSYTIPQPPPNQPPSRPHNLFPVHPPMHGVSTCSSVGQHMVYHPLNPSSNSCTPHPHILQPEAQFYSHSQSQSPYVTPTLPLASGPHTLQQWNPVLAQAPPNAYPVKTSTGPVIGSNRQTIAWEEPDLP